MTPALLPYPAYKPSGVDWLGDVPEHWDVRRLKTVCSKFGLYGANVAATQYQEAGVRFLRTTDITDDGQLKDGGVFLSKELARGYVLTDGDVLVSRSGTVGRSFLYESEIHGACSYAGYLVRFVPGSLILPKYIYLFTKTQAFEWFLRVMAILSTIENVNAEKYANAHLPVPPLSEQVAIVRYLDYVDRRVRRYVEAKRKLIALLVEERQAVIHQAVTRGLDPNVPLKPSGVEWLGDIPAHWEVRQIGHISKVGNGSTPLRENSAYWSGGTIPWLNSSSVNQGRITRATQFVTEVALRECHLPILRPGSVLVAITGQGKTRGTSAVLATKATINQHIAYITPSNLMLPEYLQMYLTAFYSTLRAISEASGSTRGALTCDDIIHFKIALPSRDEQCQLLSTVKSDLTNTEAAIARARRQIELLEEYRTRLIADVVTGKLDVRAAAESLPDEEDNREPKAIDSSPAGAGGALVPAGALE